MMPSSKSKESATTRVVPPPAGARLAGKDVPSPASSESAQKFMVWPEAPRERIAVKATSSGSNADAATDMTWKIGLTRKPSSPRQARMT